MFKLNCLFDGSHCSTRMCLLIAGFPVFQINCVRHLPDTIAHKAAFGCRRDALDCNAWIRSRTFSLSTITARSANSCSGSWSSTGYASALRRMVSR